MRTESGRSMVEMLGVLAIIGVLSVGGMSTYKKAIISSKANNLVDALQRTAIEVSSAMMQRSTPPQLSSLKSHPGDTDWLIHTDIKDSQGDPITIGLGRPSSFGEHPSATDEQFALIMNPVDKEICREVFLKSHDRSAIQELKLFERSAIESADECETGQLVAIYNRDLSSDAVLSTMKSQEECTNNGFTWCNDKGNGVSGCIKDASTCCDVVSCDAGSVCRLGQCKPCTNTRLDNGTTVCVVPGEDTTECVGGYGTPYCIHCTADQGMAHCSSYSDSDSYRDYGHTPCVCGDNYACSSHSCINCPEGQKPTCAEYVEWTTYGGGCVCAYSDENAQCADYGQCMFCQHGEERVCGLYEQNCTCVPKGKTGACSDSYYDCGCGDQSSSCIVCPEGQKAVCPRDVDNCYWCNSSPACKCVPEDEEVACADYYYGGDSCISCPTGKKPRCYEQGGYYDPPSSKCECLEENEDVICESGYYGELCKKCQSGQILKCPELSYDSSNCICVDPDAENVACTMGGDECGCSSNSGSCVMCEEGEVAYCTQQKITCCEGNYSSGGCRCLEEGQSVVCLNDSSGDFDDTCKICPKGQTGICPDEGENASMDCVCYDANTKKAECTKHSCVVCDIDQEIAKPNKDGAPVCVPVGGTSACNDENCQVCSAGQQAFIAPYSSNGICVGTNESGDCSLSGCIKCTNPQIADCSYFGSCQCITNTVGQACSVQGDCTGLCEVCTNNICTTDCSNCTAQIETDWIQPKLSSNGTMGGNSFACNASNTLGSPRLAWRAFDQSNKDSEVDCWHSAASTTSGWLSWYNSTPISVKKVKIYNRAYRSGSPNYAIKNYTIQYSDNNSSWTTAANCQHTTSEPLASGSCSVSSNSAHKYWRLNITSGYSSGYLAIGELEITATEMTTATYHEDPVTHQCVKN